jgi:hypothetical protein
VADRRAEMATLKQQQMLQKALQTMLDNGIDEADARNLLGL